MVHNSTSFTLKTLCVCVITRVTCNDSSHSLTRVNMRSSQSQVRVISQVTRVKSSHLGEISSRVKSKIPFCSVLQMLSVIINKILYSVLAAISS